MKANEIKDMTVDELNSKLAELKQELFNLRFQHAVNQLETSGCEEGYCSCKDIHS